MTEFFLFIVFWLFGFPVAVGLVTIAFAGGRVWTRIGTGLLAALVSFGAVFHFRVALLNFVFG